MSTQIVNQAIPLIAGADLSAKQYYLVELTAARTVNVCGAITDLAIGVLQNKPTSGEAATVAVSGTTKVVAGAAISAGAKVGPSTAGKAQTAVATQIPCGIALTAAAADGDIIEILLIDGGVPLAS